MSSISTIPLQTQTIDLGASATTSFSNKDSSGGFSDSSAHYLYALLIILVILLLISGSLIVRSMNVRRGQRAAILEAVANGTYVLPTVDENADRTEKPKMYELVLVDHNEGDEEKGDERSKKEKSMGKWGNLTPFSAQLLVPSHSTSLTVGMTVPEHAAHHEVIAETLATTETVSFWSAVGHWRSRTRSAIVAAVNADHAVSSNSTAQVQIHEDFDVGTRAGVGGGGQGATKKENEVEKMTPIQIAVLISMPSSLQLQSYLRTPSASEAPVVGQGHEERNAEGSEERMPVVELGVADIGMRDTS